MSNEKDVHEYDWGQEKPSGETYVVLPMQESGSRAEIAPDVESKRYGTNKPKREVITASIAHKSND